jgi:hypothetical protein
LVGGVGAASWAQDGLKRGGDSPEGASGPRARRRIARGGLGPRARRRLARGGVRPSSEMENRPRGARPSSEMEFTRRCARSSSEAETRPRGTTADRLVSRHGFFCHGPFFALGRNHAERVLGLWSYSFAFYYFSKGVFYLVIRGPLWLSLIVAPEPLQWYPLGTRRSRCLLMGHSSLLVVVLFRGAC